MTTQPDFAPFAKPTTHSLLSRLRKRTRSHPIATLSALALAIAGLALDAQAALLEDEQAIPTRLVLPLDPTGRPSPVCSACRATTKVVAAASGEGEVARVSFTFIGEHGEGYAGGARITIKLDNGHFLEPYSGTIVVVDGETRSFQIDGEEHGFTPAEIQVLYFELMTPAL